MIHLIGIDCAAQDKKCGLALGVLDGGRVRVLDVAVKVPRILSVLAPWLRRHRPDLIAIDAPLGWPLPLGNTLAAHRAGERIETPANELFRRDTDRFVKARTGKQPLDVGADRIARTAVRAVNLLDELRTETRLPLPLAWTPGAPSESSAIEVYPALTLRARAIPDTAYKGTKPEARRQRERVVSELESHVAVGAHREAMVESDDVLDSVLCLLAAADFAQGAVERPEDMERARQEGWIWFQRQSDVPTGTSA